MNTLLAFLASAFKLLGALANYFERQRLREDGAAQQRAQDAKDENERIAKAGRAADAVRDGGGVSVDEDPLNRRNARRAKR